MQWEIVLYVVSSLGCDDSSTIIRMLEDKSTVINMNCVDPLGRTAMLMAIDNENMEMLELLLENKVGKCFFREY